MHFVLSLEFIPLFGSGIFVKSLSNMGKNTRVEYVECTIYKSICPFRDNVNNHYKIQRQHVINIVLDGAESSHTLCVVVLDQ